MSTTGETNPKRNRFDSKRILITLLSAFVFIASMSYIFYEVILKQEVTLVVNGEEMTTVTTASTVSELLDELDINVKEHDDLSVDLEDELEDGMSITYDQADKVYVSIDGKTESYYTTADSIGQFLEEENIEIDENDNVSIASLDQDIFNGMFVSIDRAFTVTVYDAGEAQEEAVTNQTVEEFLNLMDIELNEHDKIDVDLDDYVTDHREINITRVVKETVVEEVRIPFQTETKNDSSLYKGESKVVQDGKEGKKEITYELTKENGKIVDKIIVSEDVVEDRVNKVVAHGTKEKVIQASSQSGFDTFRSYKYTAFCSSGCTGRTATGYNVSNTIYYDGMRIIAVDPSVIPLGSIVEVKTPSESFRAIALDTGGNINGKTIDILVDSVSEANRWGNRSVQLRVIRSGW